MKSLIKCHYNYFMSKGILIISIVVLIINILSYFFSAIGSNMIIDYIEANYNYYINCFIIIRLLLIFISVFIFSYLFIPKNDQYSYFILTSNVTRIEYFITKIVLIIIVLFIYLWILICFFYLIGFILFKGFDGNVIYLKNFLNLYLIILVYGLYSLILTLISNYIYVILIPFIIFIVGNIINDSNMNICVIKLYNFLFPNLYNNKFIYGYYHIIFIVIILILLALIIYLYKDLI